MGEDIGTRIYCIFHVRETSNDGMCNFELSHVVSAETRSPFLFLLPLSPCVVRFWIVKLHMTLIKEKVPFQIRDRSAQNPSG